MIMRTTIKFIILICGLFLYSSATYAVGLKVKKFKRLSPQEDMDNVYYPVKDAQGKQRCALIKHTIITILF